jgi:hypothetical protein
MKALVSRMVPLSPRNLKFLSDPSARCPVDQRIKTFLGAMESWMNPPTDSLIYEM